MKKKLKNFFTNLIIELYDFISYFIFVLGIILSIKFFIISPFTVVGESMYPTFKEHDFIFVNKLYDRFNDYKRGDIIVFIASGKKEPYIKRIIGMPNESVLLSGGKVFICNYTGNNCNQLQEPYLASNVISTPKCGKNFFPIKSGYFVMGDNRMMSTDSTCCFGLGCYKGATYEVPKNRVIGKVFLRIFPNPRIFK